MALEAPAPPPGTGPPNKVAPPRPGPPERVNDASSLALPREEAGGKTTRVVSAQITLGQRLAEIWRSRGLLLKLVRTEITVKYKNSVLGLVWSMVAPAMTLAVFWVVFSVITKNGIPNFVIFLFAGLLLWNLFQTGVLTGTGVVVNNAGIVKKVSFPREILALASVGSALVFFFFQACVMVIFLVVLHNPPAWSFLPILPLALLAGVVLCAALSVLLSAVNVYLRDTQHLVEVLLTALFWACPIVYSYEQTLASRLQSHGLGWIYFLNPLTPLVLSFQRVLYGKTTVVSTSAGHATFDALPAHGIGWYAGLDAIVLVFAVALFLVALTVFGRLEGNFAEEL